jgi:hypothetical protein
MSSDPGASADVLSPANPLGELHESGVLMDEEFQREKDRIPAH